MKYEVSKFEDMCLISFEMTEENLIEHLSKHIYFEITKKEIKKAKKCIKFYNKKYNIHKS